MKPLKTRWSLSGQLFVSSRFPLELDNLEKWEVILKSGDFEQTGKVGENHTKILESRGISDMLFIYYFL